MLWRCSIWVNDYGADKKNDDIGKVKQSLIQGNDYDADKKMTNGVS